VDVEDLLDEALIGVDRGIEEDERERHGDGGRRGEREREQSPTENLLEQSFNPP
jgi:hypothetical protein